MTKRRIQCPECGGNGRINEMVRLEDGGSATEEYTCSACKGDGTIPDRRKDVTVPADQWRCLVELAESWNGGDCCAAIADDMAGIIAKIGV